MKRNLLCVVILLSSVFIVNSQTAQVKRELTNVMLSNGDLTRSCVREQGGVDNAITVELIYLNVDKQPEYLVTGDGSCCGGARRCNAWIYQKVRTGYRKIFGDRDGFQGDVQVLNTQTKGWKRIRGTMYSGNESFSAIYKWNGSRYR